MSVVSTSVYGVVSCVNDCAGECPRASLSQGRYVPERPATSASALQIACAASQPVCPPTWVMLPVYVVVLAMKTMFPSAPVEVVVELTVEDSPLDDAVSLPEELLAPHMKSVSNSLHSTSLSPLTALVHSVLSSGLTAGQQALSSAHGPPVVALDSLAELDSVELDSVELDSVELDPVELDVEVGEPVNVDSDVEVSMLLPLGELVLVGSVVLLSLDTVVPLDSVDSVAVVLECGVDDVPSWIPAS
jgi:hypothetical protein